MTHLKIAEVEWMLLRCVARLDKKQDSLSIAVVDYHCFLTRNDWFVRKQKRFS
jgi:hypothetical protein